jgi:O-antigen chain-terminating bifunctional methyltransferase/kinase
MQVAKLVAALPEIYQAIYGHPELSTKISRGCVDRRGHLSKLYTALTQELGRPLRVLDLGCAQGFFSLGLADYGAQVKGVDFLDKNIALCKELAAENPGLNVTFECGAIEQELAALQPDQYDLVLGLSVFHHIVHQRGFNFVRQILAAMGRNVGAVLLEVALRQEPLYWAASQPADPRNFLADFGFVHEIATIGTHLSATARPLLFGSNKYLYLGGNIFSYNDTTTEPHRLARGTHEGTRKYYFGDRVFAKQYLLGHPKRGAYNKNEMHREQTFLQNAPEGFRIPRLIEHGSTPAEAWVITERWHGALLLDALQDGAHIDLFAVVKTILEQCILLKNSGFYHNDVRIWNVMLLNDGSPRLIDWGSITATPKDLFAPHNIFLSFYLFVRDVANRGPTDLGINRNSNALPSRMPAPFSRWATLMWNVPLNEWNYELMLRLLCAPHSGQSGSLPSIEAQDKTAAETLAAAMNASLVEFVDRIAAAVEGGDRALGLHIYEEERGQYGQGGEALDKLDSLISALRAQLQNTPG